MYINDWFNKDVIEVDLEGNTFDGWYYNRDYTKIYVNTVEGQTITLECDRTCINPDYDYND